MPLLSGTVRRCVRFLGVKTNLRAYENAVNIGPWRGIPGLLKERSYSLKVGTKKGRLAAASFCSFQAWEINPSSTRRQSDTR